MYKDKRNSKLKFIEEILKLQRQIKNAPTFDEIKKMDEVKFEKTLKFLWDNLTKKEKNKVLNSLPKNVLKDILEELAKKDEKEKKGIPLTKTFTNYVKENEEVLENIVLMIDDKKLEELDKTFFKDNDEEVVLEALIQKLSKKIEAKPENIKKVLTKTIINNQKKKKTLIKSSDDQDERRKELLKLEEELKLLWTDLVVLKRYLEMLDKDEKELFKSIASSYKTKDIKKVDIPLEDNNPSLNKVNMVLIHTLEKFKKKELELNDLKQDLKIEDGIHHNAYLEKEKALDDEIKINKIKTILVNQAISFNNGQEIENEVIKDIILKAEETNLDSIDFEIDKDIIIEDEQLEKQLEKHVKILSK